MRAVAGGEYDNFSYYINNKIHLEYIPRKKFQRPLGGRER